MQLLVTEKDIENYKKIKQDLDELRNIVEKSELWVYKSKQDKKKGDKVKKLVSDVYDPAMELTAW